MVTTYVLHLRVTYRNKQQQKQRNEKATSGQRNMCIHTVTAGVMSRPSQLEGSGRVIE